MSSVNQSGVTGGSPLAPPPPPPPPVPSQVPALRINTVSEPTINPRKPQDPYEPPAAIQNAMMTKDKKPFTYTPGMGGKLDLSQIRSPRMARRVAKNANDEGIEGPPKSSILDNNSQPANVKLQPNVYIQPQVAVAVFPTTNPPVTNTLRNAINPQNRPAPVIERQSAPSEGPKRPPTSIIISNPYQAPTSPITDSSPTTPTSPTQITLAKAPTPWMQNKTRRQDEMPEWTKRSTSSNQTIPVKTPESLESPQIYLQPSNNNTRQFVNNPTQNQQRDITRPVVKRDNERVVVPRIEDRPSVFSLMNDGTAIGHHQFKESGPPHHMPRWNQQQQQQQQQQQINRNTQPIQQPGGSYVIPIQIEGQTTTTPQQRPNNNNSNNNNNCPSSNSVNDPRESYYRNVPVFENQAARNLAYAQQQAEPAPIQSKSFRILQKITDTDHDDLEQIRKLQLTEDDRCLMNKFKEQVDGENYLHQEEDPRYRGAAIPSKAFRYLQNMTDGGESSASSSPRSANPAIKKQNRNSTSFDEHVHVVHVPASQQQVPEPKKYTGGAIPSRSFRMLQAMTMPESLGPDTSEY